MEEGIEKLFQSTDSIIQESLPQILLEFDSKLKAAFGSIKETS